MSETSKKCREWRNYISANTNHDGEYYLSISDSRKLQQLFAEVAAISGDDSYEKHGTWFRKKYNEYLDATWLMKRLTEAEGDSW